MRIGEIEIIPVPDGTAKLPPQYFVGSDWSAHQALLGPDGMMDIPIGAFLVRAAGRTVLVDAGIGPVSNPVFQGGELPSRLQAEGVTPQDVDVVVCSHLHVDHSGWLVRDGAPFFPNATVRFGAADWDQFVTNGDPSNETRIALELLQAAGRIDTIDSDGEILPGLSVMHAPGHTLGHSVIVLSSGEQRALLLGDAVTCPVQLEEPDWQAMSDIDKDLASRTREALFTELERSGDVAVAMHFPGLEFGRVLPGKGKRYFSVG